MPDGITNLHQRIVAGLGPVFIPSHPGDPGYKELEAYGITDYVMQQRPDEDAGDLRFGIAGGGADWLKPEALERFNAGSGNLFGGKSFVDLFYESREDRFPRLRAQRADDRAVPSHGHGAGGSEPRELGLFIGLRLSRHRSPAVHQWRRHPEDVLLELRPHCRECCVRVETHYREPLLQRELHKRICVSETLAAEKGDAHGAT